MHLHQVDQPEWHVPMWMIDERVLELSLLRADDRKRARERASADRDDAVGPASQDARHEPDDTAVALTHHGPASRAVTPKAPSAARGVATSRNGRSQEDGYGRGASHLDSAHMRGMSVRSILNNFELRQRVSPSRGFGSAPSSSASARPPADTGRCPTS